eukprot:TRINITY_DN8641_c1_g1_i1.p1 TRINITY_DN8641_c1_g1~~TRINITY_DN8641_c1_g1_i1.p1  ORF type:complete len:344 (-),score=48.97 TRINITY_DN8641_c1_g1_i1:9-1040(-)
MFHASRVHCAQGPTRKIAVFNSKTYDRAYLSSRDNYELTHLKQDLTPEQAQVLGKGFEGVCVFVNDDVGRKTIGHLKEHGVRFICARSAGYNNIDLQRARKEGIKVFHVPRYSPAAISEFAVGMALTLNRNIHKAYNRVRDQNFSLDGLMGFNIKDKTIGVIGTGAIGAGFARIIKAFDCRVLAYDVHRNEDLRNIVEYVSLPELYSHSDLISLHAPLTKDTEHMINDEAIRQMKGRVMLINTSRGGLIDSHALIRGLKSQKIGSVALDVYENEADLFFKDHSGDTIHDDVFSRLSSFPNVLITGHQAFLTKEAMQGIAETTFSNFDDFYAGRNTNELTKHLD